MAENEKNAAESIVTPITNILETIGKTIEKDILPTFEKVFNDVVDVIKKFVEGITGTVESAVKALPAPSQSSGSSAPASAPKPQQPQGAPKKP